MSVGVQAVTDKVRTALRYERAAKKIANIIDSKG